MTEREEIEIVHVERDVRISDVFYHFEHLTNIESARTLGRKIGVMQEVLLRKYLEADVEVMRRMYLEDLLGGYSGASHKVEFSWFAKTTIESAVIGESIDGTNGIHLAGVVPEKHQAILSLGAGGPKTRLAVGTRTRNARFKTHLQPLGIDLRVVTVSERGCSIDIIDRTKLLGALESKRVGAQRFKDSSNLGSGIQTIEKTKQASLVALDLDLHVNGTIKPLSDPAKEKQYLSLLALGNGVHWTVKDKNILRTYVDYTYLVRDSAIIRYADYVLEKAGGTEYFWDFFMKYFGGMTKAKPDDFEVIDDDFVIVAPETESRSLRQVISEHLLAVNP